MSFDRIRSTLSDYEIISKSAGDLLSRAKTADNVALRESYLGQAAYEMKDYDLAYEHFIESEKAQATADVAAKLALCRWRQLELNEAADWIKRALERDAKGTVRAICIGTTARYQSIQASIEFERGNIEAAIALADASLKVHQEDPLAEITKASGFLAKGQYSEANQALDNASKHAPPYLRQQIDVLGSLTKEMSNACLRGAPLLAQYSTLALRKAI